jgi:predicted phosphodiesterase
MILAALLTLACAAGGALGLGSVWPSTRENDLWSVETRVIPHSQVEIPTTAGTAAFDTHAWGPGARIEVSALALPPVGRSGDAPFIDIDAQLEQIKDLAWSAMIETAWKAVAGAVAGGLLGGLLWMSVRTGTRSTRRRLGIAVAAAMTGVSLCAAAWGAGFWLTFDEEYGSKLRADGLLAVGLSADKLLAELNSRDQKYAAYVQSLSTYISRLRDEADPREQGARTAVRVMLVSDVHSRNVYPQLREVIASQDVDFVVDSGDLVQWGTGFELTARPDLQAGIESLGVPYLFVKGNHDGPRTVEAVGSIPNVRVLDGRPVVLEGLGLLGVQDPRLYQDGGPAELEAPEAVEEMEVEAARQAVADLSPDAPPVDIAVMHHPSGAHELGELVGAPVWVGGHRHAPALEVTEQTVDITVGTTGAAGIRTFNRQNEAGEVIPTPQSFDILGFNSDCEPVSLTRFTYPDVLSRTGNTLVTYQTLSVETPEADEGLPARSCG